MRKSPSPRGRAAIGSHACPSTSPAEQMLSRSGVTLGGNRMTPTFCTRSRSSRRDHSLPAPGDPSHPRRHAANTAGLVTGRRGGLGGGLGSGGGGGGGLGGGVGGGGLGWGGPGGGGGGGGISRAARWQAAWCSGIAGST